MALKSMTGFGRGEACSRGLLAEVEIGSVNRKQLDIHVSLPRGLAAVESRMVQEISGKFSRGCITASVRLAAAGRGTQSVVVDAALAAACVSALRKTAAKLKLADDLSARTIASIPGIVRVNELEADAGAAWPVIREALKTALGRLAAMRATEGAALNKDLSRRLQHLRDQLAGIRKLSGSVTSKYRDALLTRLRAAGVVATPEDPQLMKELVFFADRCDITEEITRLESHFGQATKLLGSNDPVGRTLDFMIQEMFREITTIGSKANDVGISRHVVLFKTELERIREQVQNIE